MRIDDGVTRGPAFEISVDGVACRAFPGETVAVAMLAGGVAAMRRDKDGRPRGLFCNMGTCCECLVTVTLPGGMTAMRRACLLPVEDGLTITRRDDGGHG